MCLASFAQYCEIYVVPCSSNCSFIFVTLLCQLYDYTITYLLVLLLFPFGVIMNKIAMNPVINFFSVLYLFLLFIYLRLELLGDLLFIVETRLLLRMKIVCPKQTVTCDYFRCRVYR